MKTTRNLFLLVGSPPNVISALNELNFKGLITNPYWTPINEANVNEAFECNKSIVCAADDYVGKSPPEAIKINVVPTSCSGKIKIPGTIFLKSDVSIATQFEKIANDLGLDIGDHKSNSSGSTDGPTIKDCAYCKYLDGNIGQNERTLYRSKNFFVIPTLGQFIPGYLLIIPYKHVMSNGELSKAELQEFEDVLNDVVYILQLAYPSSPGILVWENGSGKSGIGKAKDSLVHSHVHVAPTSLTAEQIKKMSGFHFDEISLSDLPDYREHSYLLVQNQNQETWKINNDPRLYIPRQYVRQLIAKEYNIPGEAWNWRTHPFEDIMYQTVETISSVLIANHDSLPDRIKENTRFLVSNN